MTLLADRTSVSNFMMDNQNSEGEFHGDLQRDGSPGDMNDATFSHDKRGQLMQNGGENLMLRKTQGDLLQKLRQLRLWQQQQQEHLLQDKERKLNMIRDQERKLQLVQEYQKRALAQSGHLGGSPIGVSDQPGSHGNQLSHDESHGSHLFSQTVRPQHIDVNQNVSLMNTGNSGSRRFELPSKTLLLSPKHFQAPLSPKENNSPPEMISPDVNTVRSQNPMLLTQKINLPVVSDDELSQFTDDGSIGEIDGIHPIEDTASEVSAEDASDQDQVNDDNEENDDDDQENDEYIYQDNDSDHNETLIDEGEEEDQNEVEDEEQEQFKVDKDIDTNSKPCFDDIPIKSGLGFQAKTFEELLDEKLQAEYGDIEKTSNNHGLPVKKTFLRKGQGIARFGLKEKKVKNKKETQEKKVNEQTSSSLTRKTVANKQPVKINQDSLQESSNFPRKQARNQLSSHVIGPYTSIDVAMEREQIETPKDSGITSDEGVEIQRRIFGVTGIEDSFQERMKKYDELETVEKDELNEFEMLEEAAANCSLSSNSSTVLRILGKKSQLQQNKNKSIVGNERKISRKSPVRFHNVHSSIVEEQFDGREQLLIHDDTDSEDEDDGNNTLTKSDDENKDEDTLKNDEIVIVHSSLALSDGFNDSETWEQDDDLDIHHDPMMSLNTSTPDAKNHSRNSSLRKLPHSSSTPPTSNLVTKLFPQLKTKVNAQSKGEKLDQAIAKKQSPKSVEVSKTSLHENAVSDTKDGLSMSNAVKEKLQELEKEIEKFREENAMLHKLREEREKDLQDLQRERSSFESYKTEELETLEKFKSEEERRLRRDKRVFEQYQKASRALPDKKEREEILSLKTKINEMQEEMKLRESRWSAAATRYKDRTTNLEKENKEMKEEVRLLEKQNLELQRKDQQKTRELQQYKAFEKRKLTKPDELQTKSSVSRITLQVSDSKEVNEHLLEKDDKPKTPPSSPVQHVKEPKKSSNIVSEPSYVDHRISPSSEKHTSKERTPPNEIQQTKNPRTSSKTHNEIKQSSDPTSSSKELSPPFKQNRASKSVRFKDDESAQENEKQLLPKEICHNDGKREVINADGSRVVTFLNGTRKEISADGLSTIVTFFNGDVKQIMPDGRVVYYYSEAQTTHTTYPDGMQVLHFPSNQIEKHYPDGTKEIVFPDQTVKYLYQSGAEECVFADGTVERTTGDGDRIVEFPNGQRETYTKLFKKREYPDGTVKTVFSDGRQETRYPSGRLRVKDGEGRLLVDTADQQSQSTQ